MDKKPTRQFRFMATWITNASFKDLIKKNWDNNHSWPEAIENLIDRIKEWNREVFGNINKRKKELTNRLGVVIEPIRRGLICF